MLPTRSQVNQTVIRITRPPGKQANRVQQLQRIPLYQDLRRVSLQRKLRLQTRILLRFL